MLLYIAAAPKIALRLAARRGLSLFCELFFVYLFAHRRAVRILRTGYLFLFIFRLVQLRILLEEYQAASDDLTQKFYAISEKLYQGAQQAQGGAAPGPDAGTAPGGGEYYDADYSVVDEDDKDKK